MKKLIGFLLLAVAPMTFAAAQTPSVTFGASVTNANGSLSTTLNWSSQPTGAICQASGNPAWTGAKAGSGTFALPAITLSGTYQLTLKCDWAGDTQAGLSWTPPTVNTDGTPLTNLAGFKVYKGTLANGSDLSLLTTINSPTTLTYTATGLPVGQNCFALTAFNVPLVESAKTTVGCKTNAAGQSASQSVSLTVNPIPGTPGNVSIQ